MALLTSDKAVVEAVWKMNDQASGPMKKLSNEARLLGVQLTQARGNLFSMAGQAALFTVATAGVVKLGKSLVDENNQLEQMKLGMGALLYQAQELGYIRKQYDDINGAIKETDKIYDRLYIHSLKAIGTVDDYTQAWRELHQSVRIAGGSLQDAETIAKHIVPFAKFYNIQPDVANRDIMQLLMGRMTIRDLLPRYLGFDPATANKMTPQERLATLLQKLESGSQATAAQEHTFEAKWDTFKGNIQILQRVGGKGLFNEVKGDLDSLNNDFLTNQKEVFNVARSTGAEITSMYRDVKDAAFWGLKHFKGIKSIAEFLLRTWITMKLAGAASGFFQGASQLAANFKAWGGFSKIASQGVRGLADSVFTLGNTATAAAASIIAAIQGIRAVVNEVEEIRNFEATNKELTGASQVLGLLSAANKAGIEITDEDMKRVDEEGFRRYQKVAKDPQRNSFSQFMFYDLPAYGLKTWSSERIKAEHEDLYERERAGVLAEILNERRKSHFKFDEKIGDINTNNDFRGSHIQITVDSRHSDPNRVAATVVNELSRMAKSRTASAARLPASRGSMGRSS